MAKARENGEVKEPELTVSDRAELQRLRKENQTLKMERDFLKKVCHERWWRSRIGRLRG